MSLCICSCGRPAVLLRGDSRFSTYECKANRARAHSKSESERLARAKSLVLGGQETPAPVPSGSLSAQPDVNEMRALIEERNGVRIVNGKVFKGDLTYIDSADRLDKLREALGVSHETLAERVNLRLHRMAVSR